MSQTIYLDNPPKGFEYTAQFRSPKINDWILRRDGGIEEILRAPHSEMPCIILEKIDPNEEAIQSASAQLEMELVTKGMKEFDNQLKNLLYFYGNDNVHHLKEGITLLHRKLLEELHNKESS